MRRFFLTIAAVAVTAGVMAQINLGISGVQVATEKVFDATDSATVISAGVLSGVQTGDNVGVAASAHYAQVDADSNITITVNFTLTGAQAASYALDTTVVIEGGIINKRPLYNDSIVLDSVKIYDGDSTCFIQFRGVPSNYVTHHILTTVAAYFTDPNVGMNKDVWVRYGIVGEDEANYIAPKDTLMKSSILPRQLVVQGTKVQRTKEYDGTMNAEITTKGTLKNVVLWEDVDFDVFSTFEDRNVGNGKEVSVFFTLKGEDIANYYVPSSYSYLDGKITPIQLTATDGTATKVKEYDGTTEAEVLTPSKPVGVLGNEEVYLTTFADYEDAEVGTDKKIYFSYTIYGNGAMNYTSPEPMLYCEDGEITAIGDAVESAQTETVSVFPNPASEYVVVKAAEGQHTVEIYDARGAKVAETEFVGTEKLIDLNLKGGLYIVKIDGQSRKLVVK